MSFVDRDQFDIGISRRRFCVRNASLGLAALGASVFASESLADEAKFDDVPPSPFNLPTLTLGGMQFWTDLVVDHGWRLQRNALTGHCRMLDPQDVRQAWGSKLQVFRDFSKMRRAQNLQPYQGKVLVSLHGLMRTRRSMQSLCDFAAKNGDYQVINVGYASSRDAILGHARALHCVLKNIRGDVQIFMAAHSLGNLVIRRYWKDRLDQGEAPDPRIQRIVMLAPPNQGARLAEFFEDNQLFKTVWGLSGSQIAEWKTLQKQLTAPTKPFGILAGSAATQNPLLAGEDDWVVSVSETKLAGAHDFQVLNTSHSGIVSHKKSLECMLRFFAKGHFLDAQKRRPLTAADI